VPTISEAPAWFDAAVTMARSAHAVWHDGLRLHVAAWNDEDVQKPPLLLVHGFRAHAHWWDPIAPSFMSRHRVYALDFSGMGQSARRGSYTRQDFTDDIVAVAVWLKGRAPQKPLSVVGHSYGGSRLLDACAQSPGLVDHAIVLDTPMPMPGAIERPSNLHAGVKAVADRTALLARFRLSPEQPSLPFIRSYIAERSIVDADEGGWRWRFDPAVMAAIGGGYDQDDALRQVAVPVDIVRGACSSIVSAGMAERMAALLPLARGPFVLADAHHHLMLDQPLALVGLLKALLDDPSPNREDAHARIA
jgi:pimeloyl-ACP methyl ester carboxylesterase